LTGNAIGIRVVVRSGVVVATPEVHYNNISGNTAFAIKNETSTLVNATCNWWGAANGPGSAGPGSGDKVSTNVTFTPWLISSDLSGPCVTPPKLVTGAADAFGYEGDTLAASGELSGVGLNLAADNTVGTFIGKSDGTWLWSLATTDDVDQANIKVTATDAYGNTATDSFDYEADNVAPTATFGNNGPVNEGSAFNLSLTSPFDPSSVDTTAGFTYAFDCGDRAGYGVFGVSNTASCPTTDNGTRAVGGKIMDKDGGFTKYTTSVVVNNVRPTVGPITAPLGPVQVDTAINTSATFTDPGVLDTHTAVWDWGVGSSAGIVSEVNGSGSASGSHTYTTPGVYTIKLTVTDNDGAVSIESVYQYVVVYDPSGGFVTGGGWITSPLGAYTLDPKLTGKATFGFVAKYKKGATVPDGNTEFQFKAGNLNFKSISYEWLVVAGTNAKFKGVGTINGQGTYKFMLSADDGSPDKFRIQIWDAGDGLVYDNGSQQALGGGSIVIHK
ncbi:MAG: PKD domain-containing protein, partial [Anaerolineales bacterium]|nr:PKD domain-containing protein [Anaerolineales bacterium]